MRRALDFHFDKSKSGFVEPVIIELYFIQYITQVLKRAVLIAPYLDELSTSGEINLETPKHGRREIT